MDTINKEQTFEDWSKSLENMDFDQYSVEIKNTIINKGDFDDESKKLFADCFDYMFKLYKSGKDLDINLMKIYLEDVKGYKNIHIKQFTQIMVLLSYCGFKINLI